MNSSLSPTVSREEQGSDEAFVVHKQPLGNSGDYLHDLIDQYAGNLSFKTGSGHLFFDLVHALPDIPHHDEQKIKLCRMIADIVYPLAARFYAQAVSIQLAIKPTTITPPEKVHDAAIYAALDLNQGAVLHCFLSPHHQTTDTAPLTIASGMSVLCEPFNYQYHQIKDTQGMRPRHAGSALPNRDWPNRSVDPKDDPTTERSLTDVELGLNQKHRVDPEDPPKDSLLDPDIIPIVLAAEALVAKAHPQAASPLPTSAPAQIPTAAATAPAPVQNVVSQEMIGEAARLSEVTAHLSQVTAALASRGFDPPIPVPAQPVPVLSETSSPAPSLLARALETSGLVLVAAEKFLSEKLSEEKARSFHVTTRAHVANELLQPTSPAPSITPGVEASSVIPEALQSLERTPGPSAALQQPVQVPASVASQPQAALQTRVQPQAQPQPQAQVQLQAQVQPQPQVQIEQQAQAQSQPQAQPSSQPRAEAERRAVASQIQPSAPTGDVSSRIPEATEVAESLERVEAPSAKAEPEAPHAAPEIPSRPDLSSTAPEARPEPAPRQPSKAEAPSYGNPDNSVETTAKRDVADTPSEKAQPEASHTPPRRPEPSSMAHQAKPEYEAKQTPRRAEAPSYRNPDIYRNPDNSVETAEKLDLAEAHSEKADFDEKARPETPHAAPEASHEAPHHPEPSSTPRQAEAEEQIRRSARAESASHVEPTHVEPKGYEASPSHTSPSSSPYTSAYREAREATPPYKAEESPTASPTSHAAPSAHGQGFENAKWEAQPSVHVRHPAQTQEMPMHPQGNDYHYAAAELKQERASMTSPSSFTPSATEPAASAPRYVAAHVAGASGASVNANLFYDLEPWAQKYWRHKFELQPNDTPPTPELAALHKADIRPAMSHKADLIKPALSKTEAIKKPETHPHIKPHFPTPDMMPSLGTTEES